MELGRIFLGPVWLLYRRMYRFYIIYLLLLFIPYTTLPIFLFTPIFADFIYYHHVKRVLESNGELSGDCFSDGGLGGTSLVSAVIGGVIFVLIALVRRILWNS